MVKKEISSVKNWKEAFWETALCSVNSSHRVTAFPSRSRSLRQFSWNLQTYIWKHRLKRKHLPLKTGKMLSEKLLCVLLINLTQLQLSPQEPFRWDCSCGICKVIFGNQSRAIVNNKISSVKNWKEAFWETALCSVNSSHRVTAFP